MAEFNLINQIINTQSSSRSDVAAGIGDDCAILNIPENHSLAVSMDTLVAGVHFPVDTSAYSIGYKSLAVNLSDLAATGAVPAWATLSLTMPDENDSWLTEFMRGFYTLADQYNVQLVGGDTTCGPLTITVQIHGFVKQPLLRSNATVGDKIYVSGYLGEAALGFKQFTANDSQDNEALTRFKRPVPRVSLGLELSSIASSCIDISDGLVSDLAHICEKSSVGANISLEKIPLTESYRKYFEYDFQAALGFGDDYELCFTVPASKIHEIELLGKTLDLKLSCVGEIVPGNSVSFVDKEKNEVKLNKGYEHFND